MIVGFLGSQAMAVVSAPIVARSLSVPDRGRLGLLTALSALLGLLTTMGIPGGLMYYASSLGNRPPVSRRSLRHLVAAQTGLAAVAGAAILLPICGRDASVTVGLLGACAVVPQNYTTSVHWLLLGFDRKTEYQRYMLIASLVWLGSVVGLAIAGVHSLEAFAAAWLLFSTFPAAYGYWLLHGPRGSWTKAHEHANVPTGDIVRFGLKSIVGLVPLSEVASTEITLATFVLNPFERGLFVVATNFREPGRLFGGAMATYAAPAHARLPDAEKALHARRVAAVSVVLAVASTAVIAAIGPRVLTLAFGQKYAPARDSVRLLALAGGVGLVGRSVRGLRFGEGRPGLVSLSEIASMAVLMVGILLPAHWTLMRFVVLVFVAEVVRLLAVVATPFMHRRPASPVPETAVPAGSAEWYGPAEPPR
ncbi:MAG: lipopolysaccharide biosynthesis protein [Acidimicrobiales bacterium]